jgi:hypothetical protein
MRRMVYIAILGRHMLSDISKMTHTVPDCIIKRRPTAHVSILDWQYAQADLFL